MFNFVCLLKYKRWMTGNKLCKPAQRSWQREIEYVFEMFEMKVNKYRTVKDILTLKKNFGDKTKEKLVHGSESL